MENKLRIVSAEPDDIPLLLEFIRELASYEKLSEEVMATEAVLRESLFGADRTAEALLAHWGDEPVGFAVFFHNFSTFLGRRGLYLEDLFVRPAMRGRGIGKALMRHVARLAVDRKGGRMEWAVLDWNRSAIEFYESLRAEPMSDWTVYRLNARSLENLANGESQNSRSTSSDRDP